MSLEALFPALIRTGYTEKSPRDKDYNCIAWAAQVTDTIWEPDSMGINYWPPGVPRECTLSAYTEAFATLGYVVCGDGSLEEGFEKIAIYAVEEEPEHIARQCSNGRWTSKVGIYEDIEHPLDGLEGSRYGTVVLFLRRPTGSSQSTPS